MTSNRKCLAKHVTKVEVYILNNCCQINIFTLRCENILYQYTGTLIERRGKALAHLRLGFTYLIFHLPLKGLVPTSLGKWQSTDRRRGFLSAYAYCENSKKLKLSRAHTPRASWPSVRLCTWAEAQSQRWVWLVSVANTKATLVALVATAIWFLAKPSQFFAVFDSLVAVTVHLSARSGRFHVDNDDRRTNQLLNPLRMRAEYLCA